MGRYDFVSPGAMGGNAIAQFLIEREMRERQKMLDALNIKNTEADNRRADDTLAANVRAAQAAEGQRADAAKALENQRGFQRATTIADNAMPDDPVDEATAGLLTEHGYGGQIRKVPGVVWQGPLQEGDVAPEYADQSVMRGGSKFLNAEAQREAQERMATEARESRESQSEAQRAMQLTIAHLVADGKAESRALANRLTAIQAEIAQSKLDEATQKKTDAKTAVSATRQKLRDLASGLINDPALAGISGPIEGRRDTFFDAGAVDALARYNQLFKALSLEERGKLKGQGAISEWEGKGVESSASAMNRAAGPDMLKKHLQAIVDAFHGDMPQVGPAKASPGGGGFKVVGVR